MSDCNHPQKHQHLLGFTVKNPSAIKWCDTCGAVQSRPDEPWRVPSAMPHKPPDDGPAKEPSPERVAENEHYMWRKTEEMEKKGEL